MTKQAVIVPNGRHRPVSFRWVRYTLGFERKQLGEVALRLTHDESDLAAEVGAELRRALEALDRAAVIVGKEVTREVE